MVLTTAIGGSRSVRDPARLRAPSHQGRRCVSYFVSRKLGLAPTTNGRGVPPHVHAVVGYQRALELCEVLGIDPVEIGL
jgi:hypothetical protein